MDVNLHGFRIKFKHSDKFNMFKNDLTIRNRHIHIALCWGLKYDDEAKRDNIHGNERGSLQYKVMATGKEGLIVF